MMYFKTMSKKAEATMTARINENSKRTFTFTEHADAVEVWPAMTDKELKNACRIAALRETLRTYEDKADAILTKSVDAMTTDDKKSLLECINVAFHTSGKIEGCFSVDSCASCAFCQKMINAAACNPLFICGACYAAKDAYKEASWRRHTLNSRILSTVLFSVEELATLKIDGALCRFNEDGDTVNWIHACNLLRIAKSHPQTSFGYWYKNAAAVEAGLRAEGYNCKEDLPDNVRFIHSSLLIGFQAAPLWFDDAVFTVYPDHETTDAAIMAGAHECNGRKCSACGYNCYLMQRRGDNVLHIAEYLRCNDTTRATIRAAYDVKKASMK